MGNLVTEQPQDRTLASTTTSQLLHGDEEAVKQLLAVDVVQRREKKDSDEVDIALVVRALPSWQVHG